MKLVYLSVVTPSLFLLFLFTLPSFAQAPLPKQAQHIWLPHEKRLPCYHPNGLRVGDKVVTVCNATARFSDDAPADRHVRTMRRGQKLTILVFTKACGFWGLLPSGSMRRVWVDLGAVALDQRATHR